MKGRYNQSPNVTGVTRFTKAPMSDVEFSRMTANPKKITAFNAGNIVPIYCHEVLPHETRSIDLDFVIRQTTVLRPTMGNMDVDIYAYFVPNRIVNESWKNVQGENTSGFWTAPEVDLAPLVDEQSTGSIKVPIGSVADFYGFPTQRNIPVSVLKQCNDLKFRGYLEIYNTYFRDENYQPPIPYSKLNVFNGFFKSVGTQVGLLGGSGGTPYPVGAEADGSYPQGAIVKALYGEGGSPVGIDGFIPPFLTSFSALGAPLKANKLHDFITSALPQPQKGAEIIFGIGDMAPLASGRTYQLDGIEVSGQSSNALIGLNGGKLALTNGQIRFTDSEGNPIETKDVQYGMSATDGNINVYADLASATGISVNDLRTAIATQQVYEQLARGGSRYTELLSSFFGIATENPFSDKPTELGHIRRSLELYQVAQTSASQEGSTPQGELTAFGYTSSGGHLFTRTFLEHGYVHIFAVVRQRNLYSSYFAPDNFRRRTLDFYLPYLANISEQPIRISTLNPFDNQVDKVIGYQEAWWEYRYEPDEVSGIMRTGLNADGLGEVWTYADDFDNAFDHVNGEWLKSNAQEVMDRTLAVKSNEAPQLKALFSFKVDKQLPMPTYSVPGLDMV